MLDQEAVIDIDAPAFRIDQAGIQLDDDPGRTVGVQLEAAQVGVQVDICMQRVLIGGDAAQGAGALQCNRQIFPQQLRPRITPAHAFVALQLVVGGDDHDAWPAESVASLRRIYPQ